MKTARYFVFTCTFLGVVVAHAAAESRGTGGPDGPVKRGGNLFIKADANQDGAVTLEEIRLLAPNFPEERFKALDQNGDGQITKGETGEPRQAPRGAGNELFKRADANGDGGVTIEELQQVVPRVTAERFALLDRNGDGMIQADEAEQAQARGSEPDIRESIRKADQNGDQKISFEELRNQLPNITRERFDQMDRNHDGVLSADDRGDADRRRQSGDGPRGARVGAAQKLMEADANHDGTVTYDEVVQAKPGFPRDAYDRFDANGDGVLTSADYAEN